ncbi:MAG: ferritin [Armatimonadota bacterium]
MITKKMGDALNEQVNKEFYSAYLYLAMSAWFHTKGLDGFSNWLRIQYQEEQAHALRFYDFLIDRDYEIELLAIEQPTNIWETPLDAFKAVLEHEQYITGRINTLSDIAIEQKDHATRSMLVWFVDEQVEEEKNANDIINQLKLIGDNGYGLLMLDKELAVRVFVAPTFGQGPAA